MLLADMFNPGLKTLKVEHAPLDDVLGLLKVDESNTSELLAQSLLLGTGVNRNGG